MTFENWRLSQHGWYFQVKAPTFALPWVVCCVISLSPWCFPFHILPWSDYFPWISNRVCGDSLVSSLTLCVVIVWTRVIVWTQVKHFQRHSHLDSSWAPFLLPFGFLTFQPCASWLFECGLLSQHKWNTIRGTVPILTLLELTMTSIHSFFPFTLWFPEFPTLCVVIVSETLSEALLFWLPLSLP